MATKKKGDSGAKKAKKSSAKKAPSASKEKKPQPTKARKSAKGKSQKETKVSSSKRATKPKPKRGRKRGARNLGFGIPLPKEQPEEYDPHCPFFGKTAVRGRILKGQVISSKMHRTVKVEIQRRHYVPKYERYERRRTRLLVHNPPSINAQVGDTVRIMETRPISKTKHFVVVERVSPTEQLEKS